MRPEVKGIVRIVGMEDPGVKRATYTVTVENIKPNEQMLKLLRNGATMLQLDSSAPEDWPRGFLVFDTDVISPGVVGYESSALLQEGVAASLAKLAYMMAIEEHYARKEREKREAS